MKTSGKLIASAAVGAVLLLASCSDSGVNPSQEGGNANATRGESGEQGQEPLGDILDAAPDGKDFTEPAPIDYPVTEVSLDDVLSWEVPKADRPYRLAMLPQSLQGDYFLGTVYAADMAAQEAGVELTIMAGDGFSSPDIQMNYLRDLLQKDIDGVMLMAADVNGSVALADLAAEHDVPLVINGSLLNTNTVAQAVQSDFQIGQEAADLIASYLDDESGRGLIIAGPKQATWASLRVAGLTERIEEQYPNMEIASVAHQDFVDPAEGINTFNDAIQRDPDIDWIYNVDYNILEAESLPDRYRGNTVYVAMGLSGSARDALKEGSLTAVLGLMPGASGMIGLSNLVNLLNGEDVPAMTVYPAPLYTAENADSEQAKLETFADGYKP